jgi:hypothetical protein
MIDRVTYGYPDKRRSAKTKRKIGAWGQEFSVKTRDKKLPPLSVCNGANPVPSPLPSVAKSNS